MKIHMLFAIALASAASGCATNSAESYRDTPTAKLCMDYLTLPSYNINQDARAQALAARGESCGEFSGSARARVQADAAFQNSLNALQQQSTQQQTTQQQGMRTYNINGKMTTCTTTGLFTNCN